MSHAAMSKAEAQHHEIHADVEKTPGHMVDDDVPIEKTLTNVEHADLGAAWLAQYTGPRTEISDEESTRVRWKIDRWLMPVICYIYFA